MRRAPHRVPLTFAVLVAALLAPTVAACGSSTDGRGDGPATTITTAATTATTTTAANGSGSSPTTATSNEADGPAVPSAGCDAATPPVSLERRTLPVAELTRWYLITIPERPAGDPMPLVLDFHGLTEGAELHAKISGIGEYGASHGFVAVVPQGQGDLPRWAAGPGGSAAGDNSDLDFVAALLDEVERDACVDLSRVYVMGLSNGSMFASLLACRFADRFAAMTPIAGVTNYDDCSPSAPVPMLTIHGTADPILLFNGGVGDLVKLVSGGAVAAAAPTTTLPPTDLDGPGYPANVAAWAKRNGCEPTPTDEPVSDTVTRRTYDCPAGADVVMYVVAGGGHAWPGSEVSRSAAPIVGFTTFDIDATDLAWQFFRRFRRPT